MSEKKAAFKNIYESFGPLQKRRTESLSKLDKIRLEFEQNDYFCRKNISVFAAGSLGRLEYGENSDLDIFVISQEKHSRLDEIQLFSIIMDINKKLSFPEFSNDGQYLKVYDLEMLKRATGSPKDDEENLFTARMLLLLESQPLCNKDLYEKYICEIVSHYYRDDKGKKSFRPLFLLNDILRFWRTLCLNYEQIRLDKNRPWRKKNVNLKFSRMLTVFATVLPIIAKPMNCRDDLLLLCKKTPLERLSFGLDLLGSLELQKEYQNILQHYESFILAKENDRIEEADKIVKHDLDKRSLEFSDFLYKALNHSKIDIEYRKYLVV